jgi:hypothetical protein
LRSFWSILIAGVMMVGCRSNDCTAILAHSPWEENTKSHLDGFKHILLVSINQVYFEGQGPGRLLLHHYSGVVLKTYKGTWKPGETVSFVHAVDTPANSVTNTTARFRLFLFANQHTNTEITVDAGEFANYSADLEQVIQCVFPENESR